MTDAAGQLRKLIPAIDELRDSGLADAVARTWAASLERSPYTSLDDVPQSPVMPTRSLLSHINEVDDRTLELISITMDSYKLAVDWDLTLATAILHDVDKPLLYRLEGTTFGYAEGRSLHEHGPVGAALAVEHGVPDAIADLVRRHSPFASEGLPPTPEGTIVHYADIVSNDLACLQYGAGPIHSTVRMVPKDHP